MKYDCKLYMYSSLMNIMYLEFQCAIRWKIYDAHELLHKTKLYLRKKAS